MLITLPASAAAASPDLIPGHGAVVVRLEAGCSTLVRAAARAPLKLLAPRPRGPAAWVFVLSLGGGLVAGDRLSLDVDIGPGASALLTTQASTKVYKSRGAPATQHLRARVAEGGVLVLLPDPMCCFAGAIYEQQLRVDLDAGASLILLDWMVSGRIARGERWRFTSYSSVIEVRLGGRLVLRDALALEEAPEGSVAERLGRFNAVASAALLGPAITGLAARVLERSAAQPAIGAGPRRGPPPPLLAAAAPVGEGGAFLRVAGEDTEAVGALLRRELQGAAALLGGDPWARKLW